ncbi:hypothetical protein FGO68_gene13987 [Halteria grandinella]|uniref:Uncharacterized protein n=1 Tax=Halteria grandinella TaxID=5974 RepID=A0A8J8SXQ5_HALGN|nr:hypothetical protein FGO68_gene13987 [Halteria grandinella]
MKKSMIRKATPTAQAATSRACRRGSPAVTIRKIGTVATGSRITIRVTNSQKKWLRNVGATRVPFAVAPPKAAWVPLRIEERSLPSRTLGPLPGEPLATSWNESRSRAPDQEAQKHS